MALTANDADLQKKLTKNQKRMASFGKSVAQTRKGIGAGFGGIAGGIVGALGIRSISRASDAYTGMRNRIKTVTEDQGELNDVTEKLAAIARRTKTSLVGATTVFSRIAKNKDDMKKTNDELLRVTETLLKLGALGGSQPQEMRAALVQLSQGLASGTLRGEELNSVMEQMTPVARAIATSLRIPFGQLRAAAKDGLLTTEVVIRAMERAAESADNQFAMLDFTVGSRIGSIKDQWMLLVGAITEARPQAGNFITDILQNIEDTLVFLRQSIREPEATMSDFQRSVVTARQEKQALGGIGKGAGFVSDFINSLEAHMKGPFGIFGADNQLVDTESFERSVRLGNDPQVQKMLDVMNDQLDQQRIIAGKTAVARYSSR